MAEIWNKRVEVKVGHPGEKGRIWRGGGLHDLRIDFSVEKTGRSDPNEASCTLTNINPESRGFIRAGMFLELRAGYGEELERIFFSEITEVRSTHSSQEWSTIIQCLDGNTALNAPAIRSFSPGVDPGSILQNLIGSFQENGVSAGFVSGAIEEAAGSLRGMVSGGDLRSAMDKITRRLDMDWSVQDGAVVVPGLDNMTDGEAILLSANTGLVGSPQRTDDGWKVRARLNGRIQIYKPLLLRARDVEGLFSPMTVKHFGDTHGQSWDTEIEIYE